MKKNLFIPAVIVVLLAGCHPEENPEQLKAVNQSLEYANGVMQDANNLGYEALRQIEKDPQTAKVGAILNPRAKQIRQYADSIKAFIEDLKIELIKQSDSLKREYVEVTKQLHSSDGVGQRLLYKLAAFKDSIPAVINLDQTFSNTDNDLLRTLPLLKGYWNGLTAEQKSDYRRKWLEKSFGHSSSLMAMVMLNKLISDVLSTEKTCIDYCRSRYCILPVTYDKTKAIASLSSSYAKAGDSLELTVGMGSFTDDQKPRITIEGKEMKLNEDAIAVHKFIANGAPGKHVIPVRIDYYSPDGMQEKVWKNVMYIIADN